MTTRPINYATNYRLTISRSTNCRRAVGVIGGIHIVFHSKLCLTDVEDLESVGSWNKKDLWTYDGSHSKDYDNFNNFDGSINSSIIVRVSIGLKTPRIEHFRNLFTYRVFVKVNEIEV